MKICKTNIIRSRLDYVFFCVHLFVSILLVLVVVFYLIIRSHVWIMVVELQKHVSSIEHRVHV